MSADRELSTLAALLVLIVVMLVLVVMAWLDTRRAHERADRLQAHLDNLQDELAICICERNNARIALEDIVAGTADIDPQEALQVLKARAQRALVFVAPVTPP